MTDQQIKALLRLHAEFKTAYENALSDPTWIEGPASDIEASVWSEVLEALEATIIIDLGVDVGDGMLRYAGYAVTDKVNQ